jgi:hypothetical protein
MNNSAIYTADCMAHLKIMAVAAMVMKGLT